jgi:hypothetical protein
MSVSVADPERARATFDAAGRSRRFIRPVVRAVFLRLIVMSLLETQPHSCLLRGRNPRMRFERGLRRFRASLRLYIGATAGRKLPSCEGLYTPANCSPLYNS